MYDAAGQNKWFVTPLAVDVTVEAPPSIMETFNSATFELRAFVDVSGIFLRKAVLPVWAESVSGDFRIVKVEPSTVTVSAVGE